MKEYISIYRERYACIDILLYVFFKREKRSLIPFHPLLEIELGGSSKEEVKLHMHKHTHMRTLVYGIISHITVCKLL